MPVCSGTPRLPEFSVDTAVHILHIHGTSDGRIGLRTGSRAFDQFAIAVNGCAPESRAPIAAESDGNVGVEAYADGCLADSEFWSARGVGHCPGAAWANYPWLLARRKPGAAEDGPAPEEEFDLCDVINLPGCAPAPPPERDDGLDELPVEAFAGSGDGGQREEGARARRRWRRFRARPGRNEAKSVGDPGSIEALKEMIEEAAGEGATSP